MLSRVTGTPEGGKGGRGERRGRPERLRAREFRVPVTQREACRKQGKSDRNGFRPSPGSSASKSIKFLPDPEIRGLKIRSLRVCVTPVVLPAPKWGNGLRKASFNARLRRILESSDKYFYSLEQHLDPAVNGRRTVEAFSNIDTDKNIDQIVGWLDPNSLRPPKPIIAVVNHIPTSRIPYNGGTSPDASCQRVQWAKPSAMRWLTGDRWRFISRSPKSRSILTSLRMQSAQPLLERRTGCSSVTPRPENAAPSSTRLSKAVAVTGSNPTLICTTYCGGCHP